MSIKAIKKQLAKSLKKEAKYIKKLNRSQENLSAVKPLEWYHQLLIWESNTIQLKNKLVMAQEAERLGKLKEAR